jgi:hypothetical protein
MGGPEALEDYSASNTVSTTMLKPSSTTEVAVAPRLPSVYCVDGGRTIQGHVAISRASIARAVWCDWHAFCSRRWERDDAARCEVSTSCKRAPSSPEMQAMCRPRVPPACGHAKEILCGTKSPPR